MKKLHSLNLVKKLNLLDWNRNYIYLLGALAFILILTLSQVFVIRLDLSKGQAYSLSSISKSLVRNLDDVVNISFYTNKNIPTRTIPLQREVIDFLAEYRNINPNKVIVRTFYTDSDSDAKLKAQEARLPELRYVQIERDKYFNSVFYFGLLISYGGRTETVPQVSDVSNLEYNITAAIYKLTKNKDAKIAMFGAEPQIDQMQMFGQGGPRDKYSTLKKILGQQYEISNVVISTESAQLDVDRQNRVLLVFDTGSKTYTDAEIASIERYLNNGRHAIIFVDRYWGVPQMIAQPAQHNLFGLLKKRGIEINDDFVLSVNAELVNLATVEGQSGIVPYFMWIRTNNFADVQGYFANVESLFFPWISSLKVKDNDKFTVRKLVYSAAKSWTEPAQSTPLQPEALLSYLDARAKPPNMQQQLLVAESKMKNNLSGKLVVVPCTQFVQDSSLLASSSNIEFISNLVNNLASDGQLTGIKQRYVSSYNFHVDDKYKEVTRYGLMLILPLMFAGYGYFRLMKRRG